MASNLPLLYQDFGKAAVKFPQSIAVISNDGKNNIETVTYQELVQEIMKVTQCLDRIGLSKQSRKHFICLFMEQDICLPSLIMGILRQNAAFVCLDVKSTEDQRTTLFSLLNICWIFTISKQKTSTLAKLSQVGVLKEEIIVNGITIELWQLIGVEKEITKAVSSSMAYAIMTSGTCGNPKCVQVPHECIAPNILQLRSILDVCSSDIIFMASPLTFDPCIIELFLALTTGAAILIVSNVIKAAPSVLIEVLFPKIPCIYSGITILQCTPSIILRWCLDTVRGVVLGPQSSLKVLLLGGEPCPNLNILKSWKSPKNKTDLYNLYGITEVSCWASIHRIDFSNEHTKGIIPLGIPLKETILQVRDETGTNVLCVGQGELFIGSSTRVCCIDDESDSHQSLPLYRATGDIVKIDDKTKEVTYAHRKDAVIKRWGHRVNLALIENFSAQFEYVDDFYCVWDAKRKKLGLFIKFTSDNEDIAELVTQIRLILGKKMAYSSMPDLFLNVSEIPLTSHGKVNKRKLISLMNDELECEQKKLTHNFNASNIITAFEDLWLKYLCCSTILPNESFFAHGGNSFIALGISNDLENAGYKLPKEFILNLLDGSTFKECCECLSSITPSVNCSDKAGMRNIHKQKLPQASSKERVDAKKLKVTTVTNLATVSSSAVLYSMCRGRVYEYGTPIEAHTIATKVNDLGSICSEIVWKVDLGKCVDASPLFIQYASDYSKIVVGSHSHNLAIIQTKENEVKVLSQFVQLNDRIESSACVSLCGSYVFVGCYGGYIYCINIQSGQICWNFNTGSAVKCSPALCRDGTAIVVGSYDSTLVCIRIIDGKQLWSVKPGASGIFSSPCISQRNHLIFMGCLDGTCCAINEKDASVVWSLQLDCPIFSNPTLINGEKQVLFAEVTGLVHCMSSLLGDKLWWYQASGNIFSSFSVFSDGVGEDHILFGCHDKHVYCLELVGSNSVRLKWKSELDSPVYATPFVFPAQVSTGNNLNLVATVSTKGMIYLLDLSSGSFKHQLTLPCDVFSSPTVHKNRLIVGCRDNNVYGIKICNGSAALIL